MKKIIFVILIISFTFYLNLLGQERTKKMEKSAHEAYKNLLKETDKNKDGKISKNEFFAIMLT